jgi:hypothetical protein
MRYYSLDLCRNQRTLDGFVTQQPAAPVFSSAGLLDHIVEMIVKQDDMSLYSIIRFNKCKPAPKALQLVEHQPFRCLLKYCCPSLKDSDVPHHRKIQKEIMERAKDVEVCI